MSDTFKKDAFPLSFADTVKRLHNEPRPELGDIWARLGPLSNRVKKYSVELLEEEPFFWNVGKPFQLNWPVELDVKQVASWDEAFYTRGLVDVGETETQAVQRITALLESHSRNVERDAISDLMLDYLWKHLEKRYPEALAWYVPSDFKFALLEVILYDIGKPSFFRERWAWYDAGHFPRGLRRDGTRVIF